jgi:pimeloyl-ACP methyl ester carboxylesterase
MVASMVELEHWQFHTHYGFSLRGFHSVPSGKPLLHMLHGNGFSSLMYQPLLEKLSLHFDLFLSDAQGHGDSDHGGHFVGWNQSAELALQALRHLQPRFGDVPIYALGHSFGAVLTALINSRADSPFHKVILLDPVLFTPWMLRAMQGLDLFGLYRFNPLATKALKRRQHWPNPEQASSYLKQRSLFAHWHPDALAAYINHSMRQHEHGLTLKCRPEREAEIFSSFPRSLWPLLRKPCPETFVLYGKQTYPFVIKAVQRWQRLNSAVHSRHVDGDHCFMQQFPDQTAQFILSHWNLS